MASIGLVDWIIFAIVGFSTLISIKRGFVKEALSLATLIAAMIVSRFFGPSFAALLVDLIEVESVRNITAYVSLFFVTLIVGSMLNTLIAQFVRVAGLDGMDKLLGMFFGFARGALVVVVIVAVLARVGVSEDDWWQDSLLIPKFMAFGDWIQMIGWDNADDLMQKVRIS